MTARRTIRAGAARSDITPPVGSPHLNWGAATHEVASGVDMELYSTALYLSDGETDLVLLNLDVATLPEDLALEVRKEVSAALALALDRVYVTWTHTHSAVLLHDTPWMKQGRELFLPYREGLPSRIAQSALGAKECARPAQIGWGKGASDLGVNRRQSLEDGRIITGNDPDGPVDREVIVLRIDDEQGGPIATIVNFAMHPTIAGHENDKITPDYPGAMKRVVERNLGGLSLFLQGATGDIGPAEGFTGDLAVYRRAGARLGYEVCRMADGIRTRGGDFEFNQVVESGASLGTFKWKDQGDDAIRIRAETAVAPLVPHPVEPIEKLQSEYDRLEERLHQAHERGNPEEIQDLHYQVKRAALQLQRAQCLSEKSAVDIPVHGIALGEAALVLTPLEPFCDIGMAVKKQSPFPATLFCGYSMGGHFLCYLPTDEALDAGGYEVGITPFGRGSAGRLADASVELLKRLREYG